MQEKIRWVDEKTGNCFFECTQAEARIAMKAVDFARKDEVFMLEAQRLVTQIERVKKIVGSPVYSRVDETRTYAADGLSVNVIADMFAAIEAKGLRATHLLMKADRYADLRKSGRDVLDIETRAIFLKAGRFANLWAADVIVWENMPKDEVVIFSDSTIDTRKTPDESIRWKLVFTGAVLPPPSLLDVTLKNICERLTAIEGVLSRKAPSDS
jgi:hypothetical protein